MNKLEAVFNLFGKGLKKQKTESSEGYLDMLSAR